jgi:hypothetical protein
LLLLRQVLSRRLRRVRDFGFLDANAKRLIPASTPAGAL